MLTLIDVAVPLAFNSTPKTALESFGFWVVHLPISESVSASLLLIFADLLPQPITKSELQKIEKQEKMSFFISSFLLFKFKNKIKQYW